MRQAANSTTGRGALLCVVVAGLTLFLSSGHMHVAHGDTVAPTPVERAFVRSVNAVRSQHGLQPVAVRPALIRAARVHSHDMLETQSFSHGIFWKRLQRFGVSSGAMGESLAWSSSAVDAAPRLVEAWLESPEHRVILLDPRYSEIGVGAARGDFLGHADAIVVTADFHGAA